MLTDWINVTRVTIHGADRLYPKGIDWHLAPGINAIIGGTGLGKTTLVYALQFAVFGKVIVDASERIEREFFKDRLTKRSGKVLENDPPSVRVEFTAGSARFALTRLLLSGALRDVSCDGEPVRFSEFEGILAEKVGLKDDFAGLVHLQSHLFFFGESRFLLAWENQLQHELISLMMSDHTTYLRLRELWEAAESADSMARNLSAQAVRMERDLEAMLRHESNVDRLQVRSGAAALSEQQKNREQQVIVIRKRISDEEKSETGLNEKIARTYSEFHQKLSDLEEAQSSDLDDDLLAAALADPTVASVRHALEEFYRTPNDRGCPCCGRAGIADAVTRLAQAAAASARAGNCVVCSKTLPQRSGRSNVSRRHTDDTDARAVSLQALLFQREQVRSRIVQLKTDESQALQALAESRQTALKYAETNPNSAGETMRITIRQMRAREATAKKARDQKLAQLKRQLRQTNTVFERIQSKIAKAFKKYASLYLDEPCDVKFLTESQLPRKRGPQVKAPHAAFFPVVSGETRPSAQALSDAQRSFIDLAFRMAVIEVWHQTTKKTVTIIIETPEGAVDLAYMERVAKMMRTFGEQGHTLLITTNLNNTIFLPEVMARWPKDKRHHHILNLLIEGSPRKVQIDHRPHFDDILRKVAEHPRSL